MGNKTNKSSLDNKREETRHREWYAPKRGPQWFRSMVGMTFYPYTFQNASYPVIGSMLSSTVHWDRVLAIFIIYILGLGISAHALDARAPNKPWGEFLSKAQLLVISLVALSAALVIGVYYAIFFVPLLWVVGLLEIFFLFAYNMEPFHGKFHTDGWFAFSWGFLPVLAGYTIQGGTYVNPVPFVVGAFAFFSAYVEINASRPYKYIMKNVKISILPVYVVDLEPYSKKYESILKGIVLTVCFMALGLVVYRVF